MARRGSPASSRTVISWRAILTGCSKARSWQLTRPARAASTSTCTAGRTCRPSASAPRGERRGPGASSAHAGSGGACRAGRGGGGEIRRGAGGFVLGEETALMESLEGRRAMPRPKPPFPTEAGLFGQPTVINNVETLFAVALIVGRGADWWTGLGAGHGTKCFGLSGPLARPGLAEVEMAATLRH